MTGTTGGDAQAPETAARPRFLGPAVLSLSLVILSANAISVLMADIQAAFPDVPRVRIQSMVTVTALATLACILLSGTLSAFVSARKLLLTGLAIYTASGLAPLFLNEFEPIYFSRLLLGVGVGLIYPFTVGLIAAFFDGRERLRMMGYQFSAGNIGLSGMMLAAGFLARWGWKAAFLIYAAGAAVFLVVLFYVPEPPQKQKSESGAAAKYAINLPVVAIVVLMGLYNGSFLTVYYALAMMMRESGLGSAGELGVTYSLMTLLTVVVSANFGRVFAKLDLWLAPLAGIWLGVGFLLLSRAQSVPAATGALLFAACGNAFLWPLGSATVAMYAPWESRTFCLSLMQAAMNLGSFASPFAFGWLGAALGNASGRFTFVLAAGVLFVCAAGLLIVRPDMKRRRG